MKKISGVIFVLMLVLVGCNSGNSSTELVDQIEGEEIVYQAGWDPEAGNDTLFADKIRDYTGANYIAQVGPLENYTDKLMLDLASEVPMNLVKVADEDFGKILSNDLALDLKPYLEQYGPNIMEKISDEAWNLVTGPNGEIYGFPELQTRTDVTAVMMYRKDILEDEGLAVPTNTDEVVSTVCTLAERGYKTPWAINWGSTQFDYVLKQSFGVGRTWNEKDGSIEYFGLDDRYLDFLKMGNEIYECGGYGNDYETISQDDRNARFIQGDAVFLTAPYWEAELQSDGLEAEGLKWEDVVGIQAVIEGPDGHKSSSLDGGASYFYTFIPSYMEPYAAQTVQFVDKLYEDDFIYDAFYGVEGETYILSDDGVPIVLPGAEMPYGSGNWFKVGDFDVLARESFLGELEYKQDQLDAGEDLDPKSRAELMSNEQGMEYGVPDVMGPATTLELWGEQQDCANNKVYEFGDLYVTGKKTEEDFMALGDDLRNSCNMDAVNEEVQTWYKEYYS